MEKRLYRSESDRVLAGVAGGLAKYLEVDPTLVRIAFVVIAILTFSGAFWIYLVLWIIIPTESKVTAPAGNVLKDNVNEIKGRAEGLIENVRDTVNPKK